MIDKNLVVRRLINNRRRFKNNYKRLSNLTIAFSLDKNCLCGLEIGDKFRSPNLLVQVIEASEGEVYLIVTKIV